MDDTFYCALDEVCILSGFCDYGLWFIGLLILVSVIIGFFCFCDCGLCLMIVFALDEVLCCVTMLWYLWFDDWSMVPIFGFIVLVHFVLVLLPLSWFPPSNLVPTLPSTACCCCAVHLILWCSWVPSM